MREKLLKQAQHIVNTQKILGYAAEALKLAANTDKQEFEKYLKDISEQLYDPQSQSLTEKMYPGSLLAVIRILYPQEINEVRNLITNRVHMYMKKLENL